MKRMMLTATIAVLSLGLASGPAFAGLFQFTPGTIPDGENALTVIGDGTFELSDEPSPPPNDFQFPAISPFDVQVTGADGAGGAIPIVFSLLRASTTTGRVNLIFNNNDFGNLLLYFDVPGLERGEPIPPSVTDADGIVRWNAPGVTQARPGGGVLAGSFEGGSLLFVPEPTGGTWLAIAFLGLTASRRQTKCSGNEG